MSYVVERERPDALDLLDLELSLTGIEVIREARALADLLNSDWGRGDDVAWRGEHWADCFPDGTPAHGYAARNGQLWVVRLAGIAAYAARLAKPGVGDPLDYPDPAVARADPAVAARECLTWSEDVARWIRPALATVTMPEPS